MVASKEDLNRLRSDVDLLAQHVAKLEKRVDFLDEANKQRMIEDHRARVVARGVLLELFSNAFKFGDDR